MIFAPGNCSRINSLVGAFLDGELGHTDRLLVVRHCDTCPRCGRELEAARNIKIGLNAMPEVDCNELVLHRLRSRIADNRKATWRQLATVGLVATATATAAALFFAGFVTPPVSKSHPTDWAKMERSSDQVYVGYDPYAPPSRTVSLQK